MRGIKEYGQSFDEVPILHMVVSMCLTSAALSLAHHLLSLFLSPFLGSMSDYLSEGGMENTMEKDNIVGASSHYCPNCTKFQSY
jgi:hypothetical protein